VTETQAGETAVGPDTTVNTEEREQLRTQLRRLLERNWGDQQRREYANGNKEPGLHAFSILQDNMALNAMLVPEELGGLGGGCIEAVIAAEELGAALIPSNLLGSSMTTYLLSVAGGAVAQEVLLELTGKGAQSALVWPGTGARWTIEEIDAAVVEGSTVTGTCSFVPEAEEAAIFLAPARRGGEIGFAVIRRGGDPGGMEVAPVPSPDLFRPLSHVALSGQPCEFVSAPGGAYTGTMALASIVLAAEMVGGTRACLDRTVDYTSARKQFGQPIATFQAVKHRIADVLVALEASRALTYRAAERAAKVAVLAPDDPDYLTLARMAKAAASDAFQLAAKECVQLHGGIGFTWENPAHLYLKKWTSSSRLYGQPYELRRQVYLDALADRGALPGSGDYD
jgi:alkylation response protein AidB-like acyl-CoA dehydrogenase